MFSNTTRVCRRMSKLNEPSGFSRTPSKVSSGRRALVPEMKMKSSTRFKCGKGPLGRRLLRKHPALGVQACSRRSARARNAAATPRAARRRASRRAPRAPAPRRCGRGRRVTGTATDLSPSSHSSSSVERPCCAIVAQLGKQLRVARHRVRREALEIEMLYQGGRAVPGRARRAASCRRRCSEAAANRRSTCPITSERSGRAWATFTAETPLRTAQCATSRNSAANSFKCD